MQSLWQTFLSTVGASLDENNQCTVNHHDIPVNHDKSPPNTTISPISHYGILVTEGPDASKFLQGQTTCDTKELDKQKAQRGAFCTPKGRILSSFLAANMNNEQTLLRMSRDIVDNTQQSLHKYLAFFKAKQRNASEEYVLLGIKGPNAAVNISKAFGQAPTHKLGTSIMHNSISIQLDEQAETFECWLHADDLQNVWPLLSDNCRLTGSASWELDTIRLGIGEVQANTRELFIPQMLNYQSTGAISFTKGCFTGQEIVARMQYKGKVKRRMYRMEIVSSATIKGDTGLNDMVIKAGAELFAAGSEQSIGNIVSYALNENQNIEALAVLTSVAAEQGTLTLNNNSEPNHLSLSILDLPYHIDENN